MSFKLIQEDDKVVSMKAKVSQFERENERAPTATELDQLYEEVYV